MRPGARRSSPSSARWTASPWDAAARGPRVRTPRRPSGRRSAPSVCKHRAITSIQLLEVECDLSHALGYVISCRFARLSMSRIPRIVSRWPPQLALSALGPCRRKDTQHRPGPGHAPAPAPAHHHHGDAHATAAAPAAMRQVRDHLSLPRLECVCLRGRCFS